MKLEHNGISRGRLIDLFAAPRSGRVGGRRGVTQTVHCRSAHEHCSVDFTSRSFAFARSRRTVLYMCGRLKSIDCTTRNSRTPAPCDSSNLSFYRKRGHVERSIFSKSQQHSSNARTNINLFVRHAQTQRRAIEHLPGPEGQNSPQRCLGSVPPR